MDCTEGSPQLEKYWKIQVGLYYCDACLLLRSGDFPSREKVERLFALRLRHVRGINIEALEKKVNEAHGRIHSEQVKKALEEMDAAVDLFRLGERLAAMEAAQSAWNTANGLHNALATMPDIVAGRRAKRQRSKAGISSREQRQAERQPEWDKWQAEVDRVRANHPCLRKSRVFEVVAATFNVTRPAIAKRVAWC
ncbi:hypothetical protein ABNK63_07815 [Rhodanobacter sp. IGA1.0]|uniref:Uncharacterized protein n=1 Tax=Rhodanobacter sp. IGA1.0 TaxID=3158582 RepID=A0AAU7QP95_9GAMM